MRWVVWWRKTPSSRVQSVEVEGETVLDAIAESNRHEPAYESGRYRVDCEEG